MDTKTLMASEGEGEGEGEEHMGWTEGMLPKGALPFETLTFAEDKSSTSVSVSCRDNRSQLQESCFRCHF